MKEIIYGKRYDTETAEKICEVGSNFYGRDFRSWSGTLYRTKKGSWFVEGSGGAMTLFAESVGDSTSGGSGIRVLDDISARDMLEKAGKTEIIEKYFQIEDA